MPQEGFDGIGRLFYDCGDGKYVPLMDVNEESIVREGKPYTAEQLKETIQELELRLGDARRYFQLCQRRQAANLLQLSLHGYRLSLPTLGDKRGKRRPGD